MGQHLDRLLRERRSALDHPSRAEVVPEGAHDRERIDPRMVEEARVLGGKGGAQERVREMVGVDAPAALAFGGERFAQGLAVPRDDFGRSMCIQIEEALRQRAVPRPARQRDRRPREDDPDRPAAEPPHGCTVTTAEPVRPNTSGSYISST